MMSIKIQKIRLSSLRKALLFSRFLIALNLIVSIHTGLYARMPEQNRWLDLEVDSNLHTLSWNKTTIDSSYFRPIVVTELQIGASILSQYALGVDLSKNINQWSIQVVGGAYSYNVPKSLYDQYSNGHFFYRYDNFFLNNQRRYVRPIFQGSISYTPTKQISLKLANERYFLGNGYRSLWLSDHSGPLKYFDAGWENKHISYHYTLALMQDVYKQDSYGSKFLAMHTLSWQVNKQIGLHFFDAVVWHHRDSIENRGLDPNYLNPVIFFRPVEFSVGSPDNIMVGFGAHYKWRNRMFYYQASLDELYGQELFKGTGHFTTKFAMQFGLKGREQIAGLQVFYLLEYNFARPYTYSHQSTLKSYSQNGQPLTHPLGGNFKEWVFQGRIKKNRWEMDMRLIQGKVGLNTVGENYGSNVLISYDLRPGDYNNRILQGNTSIDFLRDLTIGYYILEKWDVKIYAGVVSRKFNFSDNVETYFSIGVRNFFQRNNWYD